MGKIIETKIDRFDGGIVNNSRDERANIFRMNQNLDALTNPQKLSPYRDLASFDSGATTSKKKIFALGCPDVVNTPNLYQLFSLGVKSGTDTAEVLRKDLSVGVTAQDFDDTSWTSPTNNQSAAGTAFFDCFVYYKSSATVGKIYGFELNSGTASYANRIFSFDPQGTAWSSSEGTLAINATYMAQGIVHSKDDVLYMPYENYIASKSGAGSFNMTALTLPRELYITSICEYGNFLAIACAHRNGNGNSRLFLWERDTTLNTLAESIDLGTGTVKVLDEIDGTLIAISLKKDSNSLVITQKVIFRALSGGRMVKLMEFKGEDTSTQLPIAKQKIDNRLYFEMAIKFNGAQREGVWSFGRTSPESGFSLFHEQTTALTSSTLHNFFCVGDYYILSHTNSGTHYTVSTSSSGTFTNPSIYESRRFNIGDSSLKKDLVGVSVMHEYLPSGGQVVFKYRKDEETSWTTILTSSTADTISKSAVNIESSGAHLPTDWKEIEFRIESTGGAEITGYSFLSEVTSKRNY